MNKNIRQAREKLRQLHTKYQDELFNINKKIDDYLAKLGDEEEE